MNLTNPDLDQLGDTRMIAPIEWQDYGLGAYTPGWSGYTAAPSMTGHPEFGWCLYSRGGACWEQRTKTEMPPEPGAEPRRVAGKWYWMHPKPPGGLTDLERRVVAQIFSQTDAEIARLILTDRLHKGTALAVLKQFSLHAEKLDKELSERLVARHTEAACAPQQSGFPEGVRQVTDEAADRRTIEVMARFGGSFVKQLAEAGRHADRDNLKRLKNAFPDYWNNYAAKHDWLSDRQPASVS